MFRQNCVGNKSSASKFVEVVARINIPVHLLEEVSSVNDAALRETEGAAGSRAEGGLHLQEIFGDCLDGRILLQIDISVVVRHGNTQREEWAG